MMRKTEYSEREEEIWNKEVWKDWTVMERKMR